MNLLKITPLLLLIVLLNCKPADDEMSIEDYTSTYQVIQGEIWDKSCVSCHVYGTTFASQSALILTADQSYAQLLNREPNNAAAKEDGLLLVGDLGLESLYKSFLWEKINAPDEEHFYADHPDYGSLMPLGGDFLTNGQLEYIRQWIVAGAPKETHVADLALLDDTTRFEATAFEPLTPPAEGQGYQFHVGPFPVPANTDREIFIYQPLHNEAPVYINRVEFVMKSGSHHFLLYNYPESMSSGSLPLEGVIRDLHKDNGQLDGSTVFHMIFQEFVAGTQWPRLNYKFPKGVALKLPANTGFDLNSHYANKQDHEVMGEVYANVHTIPEAEVEHTAYILNLNHNEFNLPAKKVTTVKKTFKTDSRINVFQLFSHAHSHMTEFKVFVDGGQHDNELVYVAYDWEHPPILELDPPLVLEAGVGLRLEVTYNNTEDHALQFGFKSTDEMMILFGAFY